MGHLKETLKVPRRKLLERKGESVGTHFKTKKEAERHAAKLRREGHETRIHRDPLNGNFIVSIIGLGIGLAIASAILKR